MKQFTTTIWDASLKTGLSQLQIWILMRNKIIRSVITTNRLMIDLSDIKGWMSDNRRIVYELLLDVDARDPRFRFKNQIQRLQRKSKRM